MVHTVGRLRILLVVNSFASSVTARNTVVVHRRLEPQPRRRAGRDQPAGPRHPLRPRRRPPRRRRRRRLRGRRHAERGRHRDRRHPDTASACCRAARRTCSPAPSDSPTTRSPPSILADGIDAGRLPSDRVTRQRALLLLPHRGRLRRRGGRGRRATGIAQALARPPDVHHGAGPRRGPAATTAGSRTSGSSRRRGVVDDGYFSIVLNTNPYTYLGNRPLDLSQAADVRPGLVAVTFRTMKATAILRSLLGRCAAGA